MEPYVGEIRMVGFNYAPQGWATCDGQLLSIAQNTALFALIGTQFGGNGTTTFALPDLRGRAALPQDAGNDFSLRAIGEAETSTSATAPVRVYNKDVVPTVCTGVDAIVAASYCSSAGGSPLHGNRPPFQVIHFIIALQGIFPSRQ